MPNKFEESPLYKREILRKKDREVKKAREQSLQNRTVDPVVKNFLSRLLSALLIFIGSGKHRTG